VNIIEKGNTNDVLKSLWPTMKKSGKVTKIFDDYEAFILFYLSPRSSVLLRGMHWVNRWSVNRRNLSTNQKSQKNWTYLSFWPDSRKSGRTCPAPSLNMSGFLLILGLAQLSQTYPAPYPGSSNPSSHNTRASLQTIKSTSKVWATKAQQDWPVNVAINNRLLACKAKLG
jgi:hypothetical protein